ncbi:ABC transporter substrate-binding protein [Prauserella marina]|uniref:Phospholipid/cholesterol/gamma-HCH transport system substrate-binding protein n=1 Tax=Prauserella marina TaxID=530584 RepID=A0A222VUF1_9PSEU|nr:MlaD family protein [Prauserella marina]ASR37452.1 ABC transporter substrate-binding protein [Prauserella marina]PWV74659.1 phospholipid/cholesterol/gamma-HCH transport system substrate-binding protein [Prauserella marina]SDD44057.1 phospholipid/cholesterol/gamma-HCH transport system substrate-binding protein [Prauserella marina]
MITRKHRLQLVAFVVIAVVSVGYAGISYAGLDRLLGTRGYEVTVRLADSGGIFVNAEVAYRGVAVGKVVAMNLTEHGIELSLDIESDAPAIPADTEAAVANRSAVGEQYVDLVPQHAEGPYLAEGSVIQQERTSIPLAPDTVLGNLDKLVASVDTRSLRTVVDETYDAFVGTGPHLRQLLDTASSFTETATEHLPETKALLSEGRIVLDTQQRQAGNIAELSTGLRTIAGQLKESDPDLRKVIDEAPELSKEVSDVLAVSGTDLGVVLANLLTTAKITTSRTDAIEQLLVAYPVISAFSRSVTSNGEGHLGFVLNLFDPPSCTRGYEDTRQRPANDESEAPANVDAYCAEPPGSPIGVRGAQNAPYAGEPVEVPAAPEQREGQGGTDGVPRKDALPGVLGFANEVLPDGIGQLLGIPR